MSRRAAVFYCPYCGEQDLEPLEDAWLCVTCTRRFEVRFLGLEP